MVDTPATTGLGLPDGFLVLAKIENHDDCVNILRVAQGIAAQRVDIADLRDHLVDLRSGSLHLGLRPLGEPTSRFLDLTARRERPYTTATALAQGFGRGYGDHQGGRRVRSGATWSPTWTAGRR